ASTSGQEVAKVNPGDKFPYLDTSGSWYQIEYQKGSKGWVAAQSAKLIQ
ncbi:SH3 domain-containing protein, partial [Candidatus Collierbacteria bacterium]|nr:SH3 domain-containing protein [Candidatus Collierbacteria bacterium]